VPNSNCLFYLVTLSASDGYQLNGSYRLNKGVNCKTTESHMGNRTSSPASDRLQYDFVPIADSGSVCRQRMTIADHLPADVVHDSN